MHALAQAKGAFITTPRTLHSSRTAATCPPHRVCPLVPVGSCGAWPGALRSTRGMLIALKTALADTMDPPCILPASAEQRNMRPGECAMNPGQCKWNNACISDLLEHISQDRNQDITVQATPSAKHHTPSATKTL